MDSQVKIPVACDKPNFIKPELLIDLPVPAPLHGLAPRVIKGQAWWDEARAKVYAENNRCCWACGAHCLPGKLQAHESYTISYRYSVMRLRYVCALCSDCHQFIHVGRLAQLVQRGALPDWEEQRILLRGVGMLERAGLEPAWPTLMRLEQLRPGGDSGELYWKLTGAGKMPTTPGSHDPAVWCLKLDGFTWKKQGDWAVCLETRQKVKLQVNY